MRFTEVNLFGPDPGDRRAEWRAEINKGIDNARAMIVVLSPAASASKFVEEELRYAQNLSRPIVPMLFQPCQLSYGMSWLERLQWVDFSKDTFLGALQRLDQTLRQLGIVPPRKRLETPPPPQLSQVILGNRQIEMSHEQKGYKLQITLARPSSFSGLIFTPPPEMGPYMLPATDMFPYSGSWSVQETSEVHLDGHWTAVPSMQQNHWPLGFYIQSVSNEALTGFGLSDFAPCTWRRWS
jgi:hypothetical protein